ncbi:hypothetical protein [Methylobacterium bullatum]|uniref:Uncharacterized protein n=1 Tax=Methylobacterium bullatum TaxID=570505 RepID=A0A679JWK4_9HYPH|nr:hypothetical protein MBLL_01928 [Methylobacterium bullatum]
MVEGSSDELIAEVLRRLYRIQEVIAREHFDALTWTLMQAIGAAAMAEAERRSFLLHEQAPPGPALKTRRKGEIIPFPSATDPTIRAAGVHARRSGRAVRKYGDAIPSVGKAGSDGGPEASS